MKQAQSMRTSGPLRRFRVETTEHNVTVITLHDAFRDYLGDRLAYSGFIARDENTHIARARSVLSAELSGYDLEILAALATRQAGGGIVRFSNLPYEKVHWSPVPGAPAHSAKASSLSEHLLFALGGLFGEPYGIAKESPRLINDLVPKQAALDLYTGEGSRKPLGLHYENAALRFARPGLNLSPKGLLLAGISEQRKGGPATLVAIAAQACRRLPDAMYSLLRSPSTYLRLPVRQRVPNGEDRLVGPVPVILGGRGREEVIASFYGDMMVPASKKAAAALAQLERALNEVCFGVRVVPGTAVYIANGAVLHGRTRFTAAFDADGRAQRWVQRLFVCDRLDAFNESAAVSDRVFDVGI